MLRSVPLVSTCDLPQPASREERQRDMHIVTPPRPWLVLLGLALGVCVTNGFARFAYGLILPAMKSSQGWSYAEAGWLNTANALG